MERFRLILGHRDQSFLFLGFPERRRVVGRLLRYMALEGGIIAPLTITRSRMGHGDPLSGHNI